LNNRIDRIAIGATRTLFVERIDEQRLAILKRRRVEKIARCKEASAFCTSGAVKQVSLARTRVPQKNDVWAFRVFGELPNLLRVRRLKFRKNLTNLSITQRASSLLLARNCSSRRSS
jgi:hypothetical protein